jgi:hypothetical protein
MITIQPKDAHGAAIGEATSITVSLLPATVIAETRAAEVIPSLVVTEAIPSPEQLVKIHRSMTKEQRDEFLRLFRASVDTAASANMVTPPKKTAIPVSQKTESVKSSKKGGGGGLGSKEITEEEGAAWLRGDLDFVLKDIKTPYIKAMWFIMKKKPWDLKKKNVAGTTNRAQIEALLLAHRGKALPTSAASEVKGEIMLIDGTIYWVVEKNVYKYDEASEEAGEYLGLLTEDDTIDYLVSKSIDFDSSAKAKPVHCAAATSATKCKAIEETDIDAIMWGRPRTLEELIPVDIRDRYDIDTETMIEWTKPTLYDAEREIAEINTIEIKFRDGQKDRTIREYMKQNKISTLHKIDLNIQKLRLWAVSQGKKLRLVQE